MNQHNLLVVENTMRKTTLEQINEEILNDLNFFEVQLFTLKALLAGLTIKSEEEKKQLQAECDDAEKALKKTGDLSSCSTTQPSSTSSNVVVSSSANGVSTSNLNLDALEARETYESSLRNIENVVTKSEYQSIARDINSVSALIEATKNTLEKIKSTKTCGITTRKMSDHDIDVLRLQSISITQVKNLFSQEDKDHQPALSQLIEKAGQCAYHTSTLHIWLRRARLILTGLLGAAAAITVIAALMTPGVNIVVAIPLVLKTLQSIGAFFFLCKSATVSMTLFGCSIPVAVPATLGSAVSGALGLTIAKKMSITAKPREIAATNTQVATLDILTDQLQKRIQFLKNADNSVTLFLLAVVDEANKMLKEGAASLLHETATSKMKKACLILQETAKLIEAKTLPDSVSALLASNTSLRCTYAQLLNAQRNPSLFSNRVSQFITNVLRATKPKPTEFKRKPGFWESAQPVLSAKQQQWFAQPVRLNQLA